jgi:hypothetical protein
VALVGVAIGSWRPVVTKISKRLYGVLNRRAMEVR